MPLLVRRSAMVIGLLASQGVAMRAQSGMGSIVGVVRDSAGHGIGVAQILIVGARAGKVIESDSAGGYRISPIGAGTLRLVARHVGYEPETISVIVHSDAVAHADFMLTAVGVTMPTTVVEGDRTRGKMG